MKKFSVHIISFIIFISPLVCLSQANPILNSFMVKKQSIAKDSANKIVFRNDSIDVNVILNFSELTSNVQQIYLKLGPTQNSSTVLNDTLVITFQNNTYYINWNNITHNLVYSKSIFVKYRLQMNPNLIWGTVSFKNNLNQVSGNKYCIVQ